MSQANEDLHGSAANLQVAVKYAREHYGEFNSNRIAFRYEAPEPPSAEQRAEFDRRRVAARAALPGWWRKMKAYPGVVAQAVLALHHRNEYGDCSACMDEMGQEWPCPTVEAVAEAIDNPVPPDLWLIMRDEMSALLGVE